MCWTGATRPHINWGQACHLHVSETAAEEATDPKGMTITTNVSRPCATALRNDRLGVYNQATSTNSCSCRLALEAQPAAWSGCRRKRCRVARVSTDIVKLGRLPMAMPLQHSHESRLRHVALLRCSVLPPAIDFSVSRKGKHALSLRRQGVHVRREDARR